MTDRLVHGRRSRSGVGSRRTLVLVLALGSSLGASFVSSASSLAQEQVLWVDSSAGEPGAAGTEGAPLATLLEAIDRVEAGRRVTIHLRAGTHAVAAPVRLDVAAESLALLGPANGAAVISTSTVGAPLLQLGEAARPSRPDDVPLSSPGSLRLEGLELRGGDVGLTVVTAIGGAGEVTVTGCRFRGQKYQAVELVAGTLGTLRAAVLDSTIVGDAVFAVDLGARAHGQLSFEVARNVLDGVPSSQGFALRHAVAISADPAAEVAGVVEGNVIRDTGVGVLLTVPGPGHAAATLDLEVRSNLIAGSSSAAANGLSDGLVLALAPVHRASIRVLGNTIVGGVGSALRWEGLDAESADSFCPHVAFELAGNVLADFDTALLAFEPSSPGGAGINPWLPDCFAVWGNVLDGSSLVGSSDNLPFDASDFVQPSAADYRLVAGSSLIDFMPLARLETAVGSTDAARRCRVADGDGDNTAVLDVGAYELDSGVCADDMAPFVRGDCNADASLAISDPMRLFNYLFRGAEAPVCLDACDANDDTAVDVSDGITVLGYLFQGTPPPPSPYPVAGLDPSPDRFVCLR